MRRTRMMVGSLAAVLAMALAAGAQDEKKKAAPGPLGLPTSATLKEKCGFDEEQVKKADKVVGEDYKDKIAEMQKKVKDAQDKKAAGQEMRTLRTEILGKLKEICKDDEQKKKFDEATAPPKKKAAANP